MSEILALEFAVFSDLETCGVVDEVFRIPGTTVAVVDLLFEREFPRSDRKRLIDRGLRVISSDGDQLLQARDHQRRIKSISLTDAVGIIVARARRAIVLASHGHLRDLTIAEALPTKDVLWVVQLLLRHGLVARRRLRNGLSSLRTDPRCRVSDTGIIELLAALDGASERVR